jgi:hypothetical protein
MGCQKSIWSLGALWVAQLVTFFLMTPPLRAQSFEVSVKFPPTEEVGAPSRTGGGGTRSPRGPCINSKIPLTALTPRNNLATTVSAHPTLFWYVPPTTAKSAVFLVSDPQGKEVYQTTLELKNTPGVVKLRLPTTVSLETGKAYRWAFSLICDPDNGDQDVLVEGLLERSELNSKQKAQLAAAKEPLQQAEVYAAAGIWQETVALITQLRQDHPNDSKIARAWKELLESVGLPAIATESLGKCCPDNNARQ